jgi:hypothetical protein
MTTQATLRSRRTKAESVYHVQITGDWVAPTSPLVKIQGCIEATEKHHDQGLQDEAVRIRLGASSWPLDWCRRPREVVHESNQAGK